MDDFDLQTIIAVLVIVAITIGVNPGALFGLDVFLPIFLLLLAFFGIQTLMRMRDVSARDLLPGILTNKEIIGITGIVSISWLYMMASMPYDQYMALLTMILSALGIMYLHRQSLAK